MLENFLPLPFVCGLCFAILLPLLGCYLRLRDEWLAALAYPHLAAAGALGSLAAGLPLMAGGVGAGVLAAGGKRMLGRHSAGTAVFALLMLAGWSLAILLTSNLPMAEAAGHALFDGQLYFAGAGHLAAAVVCMILVLPVLSGLSRSLLLARIYPQFAPKSGWRAFGVGFGFDVLAAIALAVSTMILGVMGTFALIFAPAWAAFVVFERWQTACAGALIVGLLAYLGAFFVALALDQAFGPVLSIGALCGSVIALFLRRDCAIAGSMLKGLSYDRIS